MFCPYCKCEFTPNQKWRSGQQNRFLHGVVFKLISDHTGHSVGEVKEILKGMFLTDYTTVKTLSGEKEVPFVRPTSSLTTVELEKFIEEIRHWAWHELNVSIPVPNEEIEA